MRKHLLNNLSLKLISLVLAFFLWFVVVQIGDPKDERDMGNIQVKLINTELLEQENKVYEVLDGSDKVRVKVYAPKSVFTQLRNQQADGHQHGAHYLLRIQFQHRFNQWLA